MSIRHLLYPCLTAILCANAHAATWYVDKDNTSGTEDGTSWATAFTAVQPAIDAATKKGIELTGPLPADTAFLPAIRKTVDAYICMYHDQGLIPLKTLAFETGVNVTLGLPIVRTSVDHGTALDIAWDAIADPTSLYQAVHLAAKLCQP